ncbi:hypothetical protein J6590_007877 [Homalodisca vitripennis]|nr:hypothetical protein J6590_007877 [Homalodisca vitripennis]
MFRAVMDYGVTGRAVKKGLLQVHCWNPRAFSHNRHQTVDDRPYGGGPGMLLMMQPLRDAIHEAKNHTETGVKVIYLSPQGRKLDQQGVYELAANKKLILICGRYKGIDERLITTEIDEEWSIGDYVLSGGELAAMILIDSMTRLIPGALSHESSAVEDSFAQGLLDCPHYTRPEVLYVKYRRITLTMFNLIQHIEHEQMKNLPAFRPGDSVEVKVWVVEGSKKRLQSFEGMIIAIRNRGLHSAFTVRKISNGEGVERVFQMHSPIIESITVKRCGFVRKAKLYYLRKRTGKAARIKERISS